MQGCALCINIKTNDDAQIPCPLVLKNRLGISSHKSPCASVNANDVLRYWGQPDSIVRIGQNKERWEFNKSTYKWNGVLFFIIVPIPFLFPVGKDKVSLTIENDFVTEAIDHGTKNLTIGYYYVPGHGNLLGYEVNPNQVTNYTDNAIAKSKLLISTTPKNSEIKIKDIDIPFIQGMLVDSGKYLIEVFAPGFWPRQFEINCSRGRQKISISI